MEKNDFLREFSNLNQQIEAAAATQKFDRVSHLDIARRAILKEFMNSNQPAEDAIFLNALEQCAQENAKMITKINEEMRVFKKKANRKISALQRYCN